MFYQLPNYIYVYVLSIFFFLKDFIYLFERETGRAEAGGGAKEEGKGQADCPWSTEPAGLNPRTLIP